MTDRAPIDSPCVKLCAIDAAAGLCVGCLRSLDEIGRWARMDPAERRAIMAALPDRAPRLKSAPKLT
jgi:predicted Fe-S protein YdhL (DUF1289 family)